MAARVLLLSGSLRTGSTNTACLRTAALVAPGEVECVLYEGLGHLPHFDPDLDHAPLPAAVTHLRGAIHAADGLLVCTPEYAGALPGAFKNLLDWTIGDDQPGSIYGKPVAWINVSTSPTGTRDAHESLAKVLGYAHARVVGAACAEIPVARAMLNVDGAIADFEARRQIAAAVATLARELRATS